MVFLLKVCFLDVFVSYFSFPYSLLPGVRAIREQKLVS